MTDKEIVDGLIARDNDITRYFLEKYNPLFSKLVLLVFERTVDKNECINELYLYLMENDAEKLRSFQGASTLGTWIKKVAIRFFVRMKQCHKIVEDKTTNASDDKKIEQPAKGMETEIMAKMDVDNLFSLMQNKRYEMVVKHLVIDDAEPVELAKEMGIKVSNLYNIKKRALEQMAEVMIKERRCYELAR